MRRAGHGRRKAAHTIRAYRGDLAQHTDRDVTGVDAAVLRSWSTSIADLQQSTRARKQAAVAASAGENGKRWGVEGCQDAGMVARALSFGWWRSRTNGSGLGIPWNSSIW